MWSQKVLVGFSAPRKIIVSLSTLKKKEQGWKIYGQLCKSTDRFAGEVNFTQDAGFIYRGMQVICTLNERNQLSMNSKLLALTELFKKDHLK